MKTLKTSIGVVSLLLGLFGLYTYAEDHALSTIQGDQIDLKVYDHAFAGAIRDFVAWGVVDEASFSSELIMRRDGQTVKTVFQKSENEVLGGTIRHEVDSKMVETSVEFVRIEKEAQTIWLKVDGTDIGVAIAAEKFENNHFTNPTYTVSLSGRQFSYTLKGQACFGYSLHLAMLIVGAMLH